MPGQIPEFGLEFRVAFEIEDLDGVYEIGMNEFQRFQVAANLMTH